METTDKITKDINTTLIYNKGYYNGEKKIVKRKLLKENLHSTLCVNQINKFVNAQRVLQVILETQLLGDGFIEKNKV